MARLGTLFTLALLLVSACDTGEARESGDADATSDASDTPAACVDICDQLANYYWYDDDRACFEEALTDQGYSLGTSSCESLLSEWERTSDVSVEQCEACMSSLGEGDTRPCTIIFSSCMGNGD